MGKVKVIPLILGIICVICALVGMPATLGLSTFVFIKPAEKFFQKALEDCD